MMTRITKSIALALALAAASGAAGQDKKVMQNASEMPVLPVELPKKPSELVAEGGAGLAAVTDKVEAAAEEVLRGYDIRDKAAEKQVRTVLLQVALAENRWADVLRMTEEIRALEDKAAAKATVGLISNAYARAAIAVGEGKPGFQEAFRAEFEKSVAALDWTVTQDTLQSLRGQFQILNRDLLVGTLQGGFDPNAAAQGNKIPFLMASALVSARTTLTDTLPLKDVIFSVLDKRVQSETAEKEDRWSKRLVALLPEEIKQPVTIAVWDSGFDPKVFEGRLWQNSAETANGRDDDGNGFVDDINGIAFDADFKRSTGPLRAMPAADIADIGDKLKLVKGALDLQAAVDSPEAGVIRQKIGSLKPAEVMPFQLQLAGVGLYLHGTATGFTSAEGNPAARLMHGRFDYRVEAMPDAIDEKRAAAFARYVQDTVGYFRAHGVRVVNMSWRVTEPQIAASLVKVEPDATKRAARAKGIFEKVNAALQESFRSAPEILFVAGAGNEDEDVDFVRSFPAGINLPNVITVGAVDVALQPAGFTSYGKSIDVYANGFEVPSKVPGGMPINISGTSLSAPQVTNLAGKLLALNPKLTVAEVRAIIEETATPEGPRGLKVIDPAGALERVRR